MRFEVWHSLGLSLLLCALAVPLLRPWLVRCRIIDWPEERRSHVLPTPRGGGLAIWLAFVVALAWVGGLSLPLLFIIKFASVLALLGWLDDSHSVPIAVRLAVMLAAAAGLLVFYGPVSEVEVLGQPLHHPWLWSVLGLVAVVWMINLHNFMDGSDGLAAMQAVWSGTVLGGVLYVSGERELGLAGLSLAGAGLGFLVWNRPPARIFMGDVGSLLVGGMIGLLAYAGAASGVLSIWLSLIVCVVFVVDATATLLLRGLTQGQWYTPHREHAYQRLIRAGWSHAQVLLLYGALNIALVLPALAIAIRWPWLQAIVALVLVALVGAAWAVVQRGTR